MNVMLISQCSKRALDETRRILDQFAERKGDRTWQTAITYEGLSTLRKLLKKSAKRNTAVACHWIKSGNQSELMWVVGRLNAFNERGTVPTNTTERDILRTKDENQWHTAEVIALAAAIAGLFHDVGKANNMFQKKLMSRKLLSEPYRHEWVSLRLFEAFVNGLPDREWLEKLKTVSADVDEQIQALLIKDQPNVHTGNPLRKLPAFAKLVAWLIVSHHRLPKYNGDNNPTMRAINQWITDEFGSGWNSPQAKKTQWLEKDLLDVWAFKTGTPLNSKTWQEKAHRMAKRALECNGLFSRDWLADRFTAHLARLSLMLADHCYSAREPLVEWQDKKYKAFANTDRKTGKQKQKLDEHNIGVAHNALLLAKSLPKLRQSLPSITRHKGFKQRSKNAAFSWQDKAFDLAVGLRESSKNQGFFGVNMASTGCGKTFANARIMYDLADEKLGCRFNVALGLRTLTLQTGDALQEKLNLDSDDLAVMIGSQSVRDLHEINRTHKQQEQKINSEITAEQSGSESAESIINEHQYIRYDGSLDDGRLSQWLKDSSGLHKLLSAPVLVSTIDHLMPATEGERGGKQIAPMLRLLTSDLVLDEPDDFDLADLPALCRLVNWAGMLGARVLVSSATLPPSLIQALFNAYFSGRAIFNNACGEQGVPTNINCAWFDEFGCQHNNYADADSFATGHASFIDKRIKKLNTKPSLRSAQLLPVSAASTSTVDVVGAMAHAIHSAIFSLHEKHNQPYQESGKRVSIGLVRMANINPMVAVARQCLSISPLENCRIHFCIYHSQHPLIVRSTMEARLDSALTRHNPESLWQVEEFKHALQCPEQNQIFVVFATAVAEVGRDHDYDWAIAEPSSMRSLIQLAGRVQRHRQNTPMSPNLLILQKNYKALKGEFVAYEKPGFESREFNEFILNSHDLNEILLPIQYESISAVPRIKPRPELDSKSNLVDLEHTHLSAKLFGTESNLISANRWWDANPDWSYEFQRRTPFRKSMPNEEFVLLLEEEGDEPEFHLVTDEGETVLVEKSRFVRADFPLTERTQPWVTNSAGHLLEAIAEQQDIGLREASIRYGEVRLRDTSDHWFYNKLFGIYQIKD